MAAVTPLYTVEEYEDLVGRGVLGPGDHVELLLGVIVSMTPQGSGHSGALTMADVAVRAAVAGRATIRIQMPMRAGRGSMPEPDLAVVRSRPDDYWDAHPTEALFVLEASESSLIMDRMTKGPIYAAAGVPQYCIVDLAGEAVHVHTDPDPAARRYGTVVTLRRGEHFVLVAFPDASIAVSDLFRRV